MCENMTYMYFRQNNNGGIKHAYKWAGKCYINVFLDANSILYTVTKIDLKAGISLKLINVFRSKNLALFTVTSILSIRKNRKKGWEDGKATEDSKAVQGSNRSNDR